MAAIAYETIIKYMDAIDLKGHRKAVNAPHGRFWKDTQGNNLPLATFKSLTIPGVNCNGAPVPAFNPTQPDQSPLYLILIGPWCNKVQMPKLGPHITDAGYSVVVDGTSVAGDQIKADLLAWLNQEFPTFVNPQTPGPNKSCN